MKRRFLAETIRNFGVGFMVGSFLLRIAERIIDKNDLDRLIEESKGKYG